MVIFINGNMEFRIAARMILLLGIFGKRIYALG
jgi:hypothetical protein